MKKGLKIAGIIFAVIIILMILIPLLFKGKIEQIVKDQANKSLNATLNFGSVGLNLFSSFPNLSLSIDELSIVNKAPFEGDTLIYLSSFQTSVDLWSVIFGDKIKIKSFTLKEPNIFVYVLKDSTANYNITKETAEVEDTAKSQMNIALTSYSIENGNIAYIDQTSGMMVAIKNLNHSGSADFTKDVFTIDTKTDIESLTFESGAMTLLNKVKVNLNMAVEADIPNKKFTLKDNSLQLNNLLLKFTGMAVMKDSSINLDMKFNTVRTDFKDFISLIPAVFTKNFADLKSSGKLALDGYAKGIYEKEKLPSFGLNVKVDNGYFQYPKLPTPVKNVNMDLTVNNPGGSKDKTEINLKKFHVELGSDPLDAQLVMKTPISNPYVDAIMKGRINLANIRNAVELEDVTKLSGVITADFKAKGNLGNAQKRQLEKLDASGIVSVSNIVYGSKTLPQEINVKQGILTLTPQKFNLSNTAVSFGKSDINASGGLTNVLSYVLTDDGVLNGNLNLTSNYLDVNPFIQENPKAEVKQPESKKEAVVLPERINFIMNSSFKTIIYDNLTLSNVKGMITLANQRLNLNNLSMNLLDGNLIASGYYQASSETDQAASFNLKISNFSIGKTYESFVTVKQFAPMAKYMHGNFDANLSMTTPLGGDMMPEWNQFNGSGTLNLERAEVKGFKPFEEVGSLLKINELKNPVLTNVKPSFKIVNGRFYISPFSYKIMNYNVTFAGSNGLDKSIDYSMNVEIPAENLKKQANTAISKIFKRDVDLITANKINVKAIMTGNIESPKVSASGGDVLKETTQSVQAEVKQELQKEIDKQKEQATKEITKQADTLKTKVEKEVKNRLQDLFKKKK